MKAEGIPVYEQQHAIYDNRIFRYYIDKSKFEELKRFQVKKGDLIVSCSGTIGKTSIISGGDEKGIISQALLILRSNPNIIEPKFLKYFLETSKGYNSLISTSGGSSQVNIAKKQIILDIPINIPMLSTQNKVINFLDLINKKIELLESKYDEYQKFKKYLVRNVFAQNLRFEDNNDSWKISQINEVVSEYKEKAGDSNYPILSSTLSGIFLQSDYFDKNVNSEDTQDYKVVPKGYFTYRSMSDTGIFRFNIQNIVEKGIISPAYPVFTTSGINDIYLEQYLNNSPNIKRQILTLKEGGTRYALGFNKFKKLKIEIPTINEQNKIANCFATVDEKIKNVNSELNFVKEFKKGLLQQMFV